MRAESSYNKEARSPVGAVGLMQLMPYTALKIATLLHDEDFDIREVTDPEINIGYGLYYLDRLLRYYSDNPFLAAAAYNAGPAAVNQWLGTCRDCRADEFVDSIPYYETRRYVREVIRNYEVYSRVYLGRPAMSVLPEMPKTLPENEEIF
jgi:soluble lytic murein transglycosylase